MKWSLKEGISDNLFVCQISMTKLVLEDNNY